MCDRAVAGNPAQPPPLLTAVCSFAHGCADQVFPRPQRRGMSQPLVSLTRACTGQASAHSTPSWASRTTFTCARLRQPTRRPARRCGGGRSRAATCTSGGGEGRRCGTRREPRRLTLAAADRSHEGSVSEGSRRCLGSVQLWTGRTRGGTMCARRRLSPRPRRRRPSTRTPPRACRCGRCLDISWTLPRHFLGPRLGRAAAEDAGVALHGQYD